MKVLTAFIDAKHVTTFSGCSNQPVSALSLDFLPCVAAVGLDLTKYQEEQVIALCRVTVTGSFKELWCKLLVPIP